MVTQKARILAALTRQELCSIEPNGWHPPILRTAARIGDLKADGWIINRQHCVVHGSNHVGYQLANPPQVSLSPEVAKYATPPVHDGRLW